MREEQKEQIMESWLKKLEVCRGEQTGVCYAISMVDCNDIDSDEELEIDAVLETALVEWSKKHGSGSDVFPVPGNLRDGELKNVKSGLNAMWAYQPGSQRMWNPTTYYGRKRRELADHLTKTLEAHLKNLSDVGGQDNE